MTTAQTAIASLVTRLRCEPGEHVDETVSRLIKMMMSGSQFPGFWSAEIIAPTKPDDPVWTLVQRFGTSEQTRQWESSTECQQLMKQISSLDPNQEGRVSTGFAENDSPGSVATAIVTVVKPGMEAAYAEWEAKIQYAQARFPGYAGAYLQPPSGDNHRWTTMLRFDTPDSLERWFASQERAKLLSEAEGFVKSTDFKRLSSSFPGWVHADEASGVQPANWKTALLVLLGLFPIVMLEIEFLSPHLSSLNHAVANILSLSISVALVTWVTMPLFVRMFRWWLLPEKEKYARRTAIGLLIVIGLLALELFLLAALL